jgi:hypothetical protein
MRLLLAVFAWRPVRRFAAPAIIIALAMLLLRSGSFARQQEQHAVGAVERVVRPAKHDLQQALGKVFCPRATLHHRTASWPRSTGVRVCCVAAPDPQQLGDQIAFVPGRALCAASLSLRKDRR